MEQSIESVIVLKYEIFTKPEEEVLSMIGGFVRDRICKGEYSEDFPCVILATPKTSIVYCPSTSLPIAYQIINLETIVDYQISNEEVLSEVEEHIKRNLRKGQTDHSFDCIKELEILDHKIVQRVKIIERR